MRRALISAGTLLALALSASAGLAQGRADPSAPFSWTGSYIGLQAGYGWSNSRYSDSDYLSEANPDGFIGGAYIGYNFQRDRLVLGIEADIAYSDMRGTDGQRYLSDPSISIAGVDHDLDLKSSGALRARLGYAAGRFLPYIAGGVSFGRYEYRVEDHVNGTVPFERHENRVGWNIGAGVEYAATDRVIVRAEYRYTDFGTDNFPNDYSGPYTKIELQTHDVRFGAAYRF